jgi:hypothetical protein
MLKLTYAFFCALVITSISVPRHWGQVGLSCATLNDPTALNAELIHEGSPGEAREIRGTPHTAIRFDRHTLKVRWQGGEHVFRDRPPFDEPLDGIEWVYCGYNPQIKMHLIGEQNVDVFTGVLLNDLTGALLQAGETVVFSPDERLYLAYEQPDGQDGPTIKTFTRTGSLLWKGYDGLLSADGKNVIADFDRVWWSGNDYLIAEYAVSGRVQKLILVTSGTRKWVWKENGTE